MPVLLTELFASILTPKGESSAARLPKNVSADGANSPAARQQCILRYEPCHGTCEGLCNTVATIPETCAELAKFSTGLETSAKVRLDLLTHQTLSEKFSTPAPMSGEESR